MSASTVPARSPSTLPPRLVILLQWASTPWTIFLVALAARIAWVLTLPNELIWIDEKQFAEIARHIATGDGYVSSSYRANPVIPAYLAAFFRLFGDSVLYPRLGQAVIGALSCVLVQRLGKRIAGDTAGAIAGLLVALYPGHIYLSGVFYVDCIAVLLATAWLLATYRTMESPRPLGAAAAAGVLFGLLTLTRPTFLAVAPLATTFFFLLPGARLAPALRSAALFTVLCAITIGPWTIRNYRAYNRVVIVSSGLWDTLWKGNNELADGGPSDRFLGWTFDLWKERLAATPEPRRSEIEAKYDDLERRYQEIRPHVADAMLARDEVLKPVVIELLREDPRRFLTLFARKVATLFNAFTGTGDSNIHTASRLTLVVALYFYPLLALAAAGVVMTARDWRRHAPIVLLIAAWAGLHGILTSCTRFRLPIDPFLFLLAATAIVRLLDQRARRSA
jgi:4-amino-4-deoxy-L-arabinose transferase-like glycosyltransferase